MRLKRFLLWTFLVLVLLLAGAATWLFTADLGIFKGQVERIVSEQLGREFRIDGELHVHLGKTIEISATDLRLASPDWARAPSLGTIGRLEAGIELISLFEPPIVIDRLLGADLNLAVEVSAEGEGSWALAGPEANVGGTATSTTEVMFHHIEVNDLAVSFWGPNAIEPHIGRIDSFTQSQNAQGMLDIVTIGSINGFPAEYRGTLGPFDSLVSGQNLHYEGEGLFGTLEFKGRGFVDSLSRPRHPEFDVVIQGPALEDVTAMLGVEVSPAQGPYLLTAAGKVEQGRMKIDLDADISDFVIALHGSSRSISEFDSIDFRLTAHGPDLGSFTRALGAGEWPAEPFDISGAVHREDSMLEIEDLQLSVGGMQLDLDGTLSNFPKFNNTRAELNVSGPDVASFRDLLGISGAAEGPFAIRLNLASRPEGTDVIEGELSSEFGVVLLSGLMTHDPGYVGSRLDVTIEGDSARRILDAWGIPGFADEPFSLEANFEVLNDGIEFDEGILATLNDDRWKISGFVSKTPLEGGSDLKFEASGNDLSQFAPLAGTDAPIPKQPYQLAGQLRVTDAGFRIDRLTGKVGPNDLAFDGLIARDFKAGGTDFTFTLAGPDLETLVRDSVDFDVPADAFEARGHFRHLKEGIRLEDFELDIGALTARADLDIRLPFSAAEGHFSLDVAGPDINVVLPEIPGLEPLNQPFEARALGQVSSGVWTVERARLDIADAYLSLSGVLDQMPDLSATNIDFEIRAPTRGSLGVWGGQPWPRRSIEVNAHLNGTTNQFRMENMHAQLSDSDFTGSLVIDLSGAVPDVRANLQSQLLDMREWLLEEHEEADTQPAEPSDGRRIPDIRFPLEEMASLNAEIRFDAQDFITRKGQSLKNFRLNTILRDGALTIEEVHAEGIDGFVHGSASLVPQRGGVADLALDFEVTGLKLDLSRSRDVHPEAEFPTVDVELKVGGYGRGLREAAATMNGHLHANGTPGVIPDSMLSVLDKGLLQQVFGVILPKTEESRTTNLQCFAARLEAREGLVQAAPGMVIVTDKVQMVSSGKVNLRNERLDLTFQTHATKAYQANVSEVLLNPFVKISGTLAKPKLTLDAPRAIISTGAAIGTGGLSILAKGLWDRMRGAKDPCARFMKDGDK